MVPAKETAEEQLLHMIEGPSNPGSSPQRPGRTAWFGQLIEAFRGGAEAIRRRARSLRPRTDRSDVFLQRLRLINGILWVVLLGLGGYLVVDLVMLRPEKPTLASSSRGVTAPVPTGVEVEAPGATMRPLDEYQQALKRRNPFRLASGHIAQDVTKPEQAEDQFNKLISNLTVVGINRGQVPEALIEDSDARRTYFVTVGEQVNGLTVEEINVQGVLVSYDGESGYIP